MTTPGVAAIVCGSLLDQKVIGTFVKAAGAWDVVTAGSLDELTASVDLMVLDVGDPADLDRIREATTRDTVVIATGRDFAFSTRKACMNAGAFDYIVLGEASPMELRRLIERAFP